MSRQRNPSGAGSPTRPSTSWPTPLPSTPPKAAEDEQALAPGRGAIDRTPGREQVNGTAEDGYLHCGPTGAGHFVKMVHNGIEYGLMAAYAEGLNILRHANVGTRGRTIDAETTPLRTPDHYR